MQPKSINQELLQRVSLETGISLDTVESVAGFQGEFTAGIIKEGLFEGVMWPYLGKIAAPIEKVQKKNDKVGRVPYNKIEKPNQ